MFANVANMKSLFFDPPNDANIKEIGEIFYLRDAIIPIDTSDIKDVLEGAANAIVLHGKATGYNRCADAIEDAVLHICTIASISLISVGASLGLLMKIITLVAEKRS